MDPAYRKQREETLEKIRQKETAIATLDEALFKQNLQLMEFEHAIGSLRYGLENEKAAVAPITLLPPEILYRILLCLLEPQFGHSWSDYMKDEATLAESVRRLSLVSKLWHSVIENGPGIWTAGAFHEGGPHVARVQKWISRSGGLPLQAVLHMRLGNPLRVFWTKHVGQVRSRISSVWILVPNPNPRVRDDDPEVCHESLRLLETAGCLTQLVISNFRFHDPAVMENLHPLHFPALQIFRSSDSDVPPVEAPCLRILAVNMFTTICGSHLWNMIVKAPRLERLNILKPTVLPIWDEHLPPIPELQHLRNLETAISLQDDLTPSSDQLQMNILNACHPSVLRTATIYFTTAFWRCNLDFSRFTSLTDLCLKLTPNQRPPFGGLYHSIAVLITVLERMLNLEGLRLLGDPKRGVSYEFDLLVQVFLLPEDPKAAKLCPRLKSMHLILGILHWPMLLRRMLRDRLGAAAQPESTSTFTLSLTGVGLKHGMKRLPKRERELSFTNSEQTNEKSLHEFERLMRKTGLGPEPDRLKPAFDIPCPKQRLVFLCNLLGHAIIPQTEPEVEVGTANE